MNSKLLITAVAVALLLFAAISSEAKTRVYVSSSVTIAGVIGGGIYWYISVGTNISRKDSGIKLALLEESELNRTELPDAGRGSRSRPELYLPLYRLIF